MIFIYISRTFSSKRWFLEFSYSSTWGIFFEYKISLISYSCSLMTNTLRKYTKYTLTINSLWYYEWAAFWKYTSIPNRFIKCNIFGLFSGKKINCWEIRKIQLYWEYWTLRIVFDDNIWLFDNFPYFPTSFEVLPRLLSI